MHAPSSFITLLLTGEEICLNLSALHFFEDLIFFMVCNPNAPANDQHLWNDSNVQLQFVGKDFGIVVDSGFALNPNYEHNKILGVTPEKRVRQKSHLLMEEKEK